MPAAPGGRSSLYSGSIVRYPDGSFMIAISTRPKPGNWLGLKSDDGFRLVLRLYDTSVTRNSDFTAPTMPEIKRVECRP
jgi:hypothetical protein